MTATRASLLAVAVTATWGSSFILMKNVADSVPALGFLSLRFGLSSLILALIFCRQLTKYTLKTMIHSLILGALLAAYMIFQVTGLRYTSASNSAFITSLSVLMVPFLSAFLLKKMPTKSNWAGVFMALLGLVFITGIYRGITALSIGDLLTFISAIFVAIHIIVADHYLKTDDSLLLGIGQIFGGALLSILVWTIKTPQSFLTVTYTQTLLTSVILTSLLCTCFAFTGQLVVQKHLPPARVAVLFTLEPVFAYLFALVIPGAEGVTEPLLWSKALGCVLVVGGMIVSESGILNRRK